MADFDMPSNSPLNGGGMATMPWLSWYQRVHNVVVAQQQSGTTAQRPTSGLYIGRRYYDTTLNKPVYFSALPNVWRDAANSVDASVTYDPASLAAGASSISGDFAVTGAALGDFVQVAAPYNLQGVKAEAYVKAAGVVVVILTNTTSAAVDLASGSWKLRVTR